jgi:hypothetical protein
MLDPCIHATVFLACLCFKEAKMTILPKPRKDPKFPRILRPISHLYTTGELVEEVILKIFQRRIEERGLLNAS